MDGSSLVGRLPSLRTVRRLVVGLVVVVALVLGHSFVTNELVASGATGSGDIDRTLVATIDGTGPGQIVAYGPDGNVQYRNESLWIYHDVDPVGGSEQTVSFVASNVTSGPRCSEDKCLLNVVRRVNLSTGEGERVYSWTVERGGSTQIHDVDRVNESVLLVAEIDFPDEVRMVDQTTGEVIWRWRVSQAFDEESGGDYPSDWTHLNDVEYLDDGRVMATLRNHDQVVFIEPGEGIQHDWTLGADGNHSVLYEQHNADYIPAEQGGPALLIADSENNRVVEYQRVDGGWEQSWVWADKRLQWPRDADRMPNGNTVIVDSHGSRILSVTPNGTVAWSRPFPDGGYDVEVLGTGDESTGPSAVRANLTSQTAEESAGLDPSYRLVSAVPPLVLHGVLYALPSWTAPFDAVLVLAVGAAVPLWVAVEGTATLRRRYRQ